LIDRRTGGQQQQQQQLARAKLARAETKGPNRKSGQSRTHKIKPAYSRPKPFSSDPMGNIMSVRRAGNLQFIVFAWESAVKGWII